MTASFVSSVSDDLGLWAGSRPVGAVSFGISEDANQEPQLLYRANLPAGSKEAEAAFEEREAVLSRMDAALAGIPGHLDGLAARKLARPPRGSGQVSYGLSSAGGESALDEELLAHLAAVDAHAAGGLEKAAVSFGLGESAGETWEDARQSLDDFIRQIDRDVLHFAWVETSVEDQLIARTSVDWSGDAQTTWQAGAQEDFLDLHRRNLQFVTRTRAARIRLFMTVTSGAVRVAGLFTTPGGALLALPVVYQYVTKILAQTRELQNIQTS